MLLIQGSSVETSFQKGAYIAAGCESEVYACGDSAVLKFFNKKIPAENIGYVYTKHLTLDETEGVCPMLDRGIDQYSGREFLVFKYIPGRSLADISKFRSLTLFEAFRLVRKVSMIIARMHKRGVVHGDIHGENVMMDETGKITLIDLYSKEKSMSDDVVDICKLFHELKYDNETLPHEIKDIFPKKKDAILRRYDNIYQLQKKMLELTT